VRAIAVADTDSYIKWAAALLSRLPEDWQAELVIVRTAKQPSDDQLRTALAGAAASIRVTNARDFDDVITHVASERPDVVLVSTIGPLADLVTEGILDASDVRPVIVSGLPGIALPARRKALIYRSQADLVVLHSTQEVRRFRAVARTNDLHHEFGLATLPFLSEHGRSGEGTDIVFAAQAIVPPRLDDRVRLLGWLVDLAARTPGQRVVVKIRAVEGEEQTHEEEHGYAALLAEYFPTAPANLVVEGGPMADHLSRAAGLVTVSSTAAIEAIAVDVPVLVIDSFGVTPELINEVFEGSGLLGGQSDLLARRFHRAEPEWLADNYFHGESADTWLTALVSLVARNRSGQLPVRDRIVRGPGGTLRRAWDRKRVLGRYDNRLSGYVALAIGTPARSLLLGLRGLVALTGEPQSTGNAIPLNDEAASRNTPRRRP
jgi:hypothetical protein